MAGALPCVALTFRELCYLNTVVQSLRKILRYRKTYRIEVTYVNFQDNHPTEGLPVFDDGTILPKTMGEPFVN
jgi:hypothetical protein